MRSRSNPTTSYAFFFTKEPVTSVARSLGVDKKTLKRWWVQKFGEEGYQSRVSIGRPEISEHERKERRRARDKKWLATGNNLAHFRATQKAHREAHRIHYKAIQQRYYQENAEELRAYAKRYREDHKEQIRAVAKKRRHSSPEELLYKLSKQRAKRLGLSFDLTPEYIQSITPALCPITLKSFEIGVGRPVPQSMTLDKVVPHLGYVEGNVAVISRLANTIKQDCTDPEVFRRMADYLSGEVVLTKQADSRHKRTPASTYRTEKALLKSARQRSRIVGIPFRLGLGDVLACFPANGLCPITRVPLVTNSGRPRFDSASLDRIDPSLGYSPGNVAVISYLANTIKQDVTDPEIFLRLAVYLESFLVKARRAS
jgi:hypothetical protein